MVVKIFILGWVILLVAILLNVVATRLGIDTWYPFLNNAGKVGFLKAISENSILSKLFLFIIYPLLLGITAYLFLSRFR